MRSHDPLQGVGLGWWEWGWAQHQQWGEGEEVEGGEEGEARLSPAVL